MSISKIDFAATRERCKIIKQSELGRILHESTAVVNQVMNGTYPAMNSLRAQAILQWLRERGYLVEVEEPGDFEPQRSGEDRRQNGDPDTFPAGFDERCGKDRRSGETA